MTRHFFLQLIGDVIIQHKAQVGFAAGAVEQDDLPALVGLKKRRHQLYIMIDLIVFADFIVFQLAVPGENTDGLEQLPRPIQRDVIIPVAQQGIAFGLPRRRLIPALALFHLHAPGRALDFPLPGAFDINQRGRLVLFRLIGKVRHRLTHGAFYALPRPGQLPPRIGPVQRRGEGLPARDKRHIQRGKKSRGFRSAATQFPAERGRVLLFLPVS